MADWRERRAATGRTSVVPPGDQVESFRNGSRGGVPPAPRAECERLAPDGALLPRRPEGVPGVSFERSRSREGEGAPVSRPSRRPRVPVAPARAWRQPRDGGAPTRLPALAVPPPGPAGARDRQPRGAGLDPEARQAPPPCPERA